ncbi:hypothetical protein C8R45DRAFT_1182530 [Mycena sanguinolenta]|nr:hypothetical protein C8R45DRAFT_1182530 [Mycena sanguinolenta]
MRHTFYAVPLALAGFTLANPTLQQMLGFLQQFNEDFSYPNNIAVAKTVNYTGFSQDVVGRVDVTETFIGQELNTEYLFGLFAGIATGAVAGTPLLGVPLNGTLVDLVIENNLMIVTTLRDFNWTVAIEPTLWQLKFLFNDEGLVTQYDAILYRSSALFANVQPKIAQAVIKELGLPPNTSDTVALQTRAATDQDGQNTAMCRYVHTPMLQLRPGVHCPHVGPSGGDMCYDHTYESMVQSPFPQPFVALPDNLTLADLGL